MKKYLIKRFFISIVTIWILVTACFFLIRAIPGSPFQTGGTLLSKETEERMMHYYGLDRPSIEQYFTYLGNLLKGDLGTSLKYTNRSVNSVIKQCFPVSAVLGLTALAISYPISLLLGIVAAHKRGKAVDYICIILAVIGVSLPNFVLATFFQYVFAVKLKWLPAAQWKSPAHMVLPVLSLSIAQLGGSRTMRASMLDVMSQDYIKTARAKGISKWKVILKHEIGNAYIPLLSGLGSLIASTVMGTFVIEEIFAIPGLGKYFVTSIKSLDYTMVVGLTVFYGTFLVFANFAVDLLYGIIDPRIRIVKGDKE